MLRALANTQLPNSVSTELSWFLGVLGSCSRGKPVGDSEFLAKHVGLTHPEALAEVKWGNTGHTTAHTRSL